jgi:hypothetical protein
MAFAWQSGLICGGAIYKGRGRVAEVERALLVSKQATKKGKIVANSNGEEDDLEGFTERVLMSMVFDVSQLEKNVERLKVQVFTLAKARGIVPPTDVED